MDTYNSVTKENMDTIWNSITTEFNEGTIKDKGIKLPKLHTKKSFALCTLFINDKVSKRNAEENWLEYSQKSTDLQAYRHLSTQDGFYVVKSTDKIGRERNFKRGEYALIKPDWTTTVFPGWLPNRRTSVRAEDWEDLKRQYDNRCATCGSKEGESHYKWPEHITCLEKGHMDPTKDLIIGENVIPQCELCNKMYKDKFIFDVRGNTVCENKESRLWKN